MPSNANSHIGDPVEEVPTIDPDDTCNGKRSSGAGEFEGYCDRPAGEGTNHEGTGRCAECAGNSTGPKTEAGKLASRQNGTKHNLTADPESYAETLDSEEERNFVYDVAHAVEQRIHENTGDLDFLDEVLARRIAIQLHIAMKASGYFGQQGLFERIQTDDGQIEVPNRMLEHIRQYDKDLVNNLEKIGATKSKDADIDALTLWREA